MVVYRIEYRDIRGEDPCVMEFGEESKALLAYESLLNDSFVYNCKYVGKRTYL